MAEYIEREALMGVLDDAKYAVPSNDFQRGVNASVEVLTKEVKYLPTADVVPKSDYDAVVSAVDNSTKEFLKLHDTYQEQKAEIERLNQILDSYALQYGTVTVKQAVMDKAKAEVAREIFAEIEERLLPSNTSGEYRGDSIEWFDYYDLHLAEDIAELKKKYTEGEPNGHV